MKLERMWNNIIEPGTMKSMMHVPTGTKYNNKIVQLWRLTCQLKLVRFLPLTASRGGVEQGTRDVPTLPRESRMH
jgi:hypothetical protein